MSEYHKALNRLYLEHQRRQSRKRAAIWLGVGLLGMAGLGVLGMVLR